VGFSVRHRPAAAIGPATARLTTLILQSRPHPEQSFRACVGILRLVRSYGRERLEAACACSRSAPAPTAAFSRSCNVPQISSYGRSTGEVRMWSPSPAMTFTGTVAPVFM
jgi:hypothetical protein